MRSVSAWHESVNSKKQDKPLRVMIPMFLIIMIMMTLRFKTNSTMLVMEWIIKCRVLKIQLNDPPGGKAPQIHLRLIKLKKIKIIVMMCTMKVVISMPSKLVTEGCKEKPEKKSKKKKNWNSSSNENRSYSKVNLLSHLNNRVNKRHSNRRKRRCSRKNQTWH